MSRINYNPYCNKWELSHISNLTVMIMYCFHNNNPIHFTIIKNLQMIDPKFAFWSMIDRSSFDRPDRSFSGIVLPLVCADFVLPGYGVAIQCHPQLPQHPTKHCDHWRLCCGCSAVCLVRVSGEGWSHSGRLCAVCNLHHAVVCSSQLVGDVLQVGFLRKVVLMNVLN